MVSAKSNARNLFKKNLNVNTIFEDIRERLIESHATETLSYFFRKESIHSSKAR